MLKIRAAQQNQLAINLFIERLQNHWRENFRHKFAALSENEGNQLAHNAVREARDKGIENEDDIIVYADLCLAAASGFAAQLKSQEKLNVRD